MKNENEIVAGNEVARPLARVMARELSEKEIAQVTGGEYSYGLSGTIPNSWTAVDKDRPE
jgi:hypothetical protein